MLTVITLNETTMTATLDFNTAKAMAAGFGATLETRHNWTTPERAAEVAANLSASTGRFYIAIDNGAGTWPQHDIIEAPKVGDPVSYGFNGDRYPDGAILRVSPSLKVVTTKKGKYYRRKKTGRWVRAGCWALIPGHVTTRNPHL